MLLVCIESLPMHLPKEVGSTWANVSECFIESIGCDAELSRPPSMDSIWWISSLDADVVTWGGSGTMSFILASDACFAGVLASSAFFPNSSVATDLSCSKFKIMHNRKLLITIWISLVFLPTILYLIPYQMQGFPYPLPWSHWIPWLVDELHSQSHSLHSLFWKPDTHIDNN